MADQSLSGLVSTIQSAVTALTNIASSLSKAFPQQAGTSTSATAGTAGALPTQVAGYLSITVNGQTVKVPYFNG